MEKEGKRKRGKLQTLRSLSGFKFVCLEIKKKIKMEETGHAAVQVMTPNKYPDIQTDQMLF